jgi:hypothetical protein
MADIFDGALVTLECQGDFHNPDFRFLDGLTASGGVKLSSDFQGVFTGTHWQCSERADGSFTFACAGAIPGNRYLDGRTQDGTVGLAGDTLPPFSGTAWGVQQVSPGLVRLACRGDFQNPDHVFLDGRTLPNDGSVGLARSQDPPSGTIWRIQQLGTPSLSVQTTRDQLGANLELTGAGFTGQDSVIIEAEGLVGRQNHAPLSLGAFFNTAPDGSFHGFVEIRIWPLGQPSDLAVVIRATDHNGITAAGTTFGFSA